MGGKELDRLALGQHRGKNLPKPPTGKKKKQVGGQGEGSKWVGSGEKKLWEVEGSVSSRVTK